MGLEFSAGELARYFDLASGEAAGMVIAKCDAQGFVQHASRGLLRTHSAAAQPLLAPHLLDLVAAADEPIVRSAFAHATSGAPDAPWHEIRMEAIGGGTRWYALRLVPAGRDGEVIALLRDVHERRMLEDRLFAARLTDPLTGLTNRLAFDEMLAHVVARGLRGCLGLFAVDHLRAFNHRYGPASGDEVLAGFAAVLRAVMRRGDTLSRIGGTTFAVLFLDTTVEEARLLAGEAQAVFAGERVAEIDQVPALSASVGISAFGDDAATTLHTAERALLVGRAAQRGRVACAEGASDRLPRITSAG